MGKLQLLFGASVQPGFIPFRGTADTNLTPWPLRVHCPDSSARASFSQHHHANILHPTLLMMPPAVPNMLFVSAAAVWCPLSRFDSQNAPWGGPGLKAV